MTGTNLAWFIMLSAAAHAGLLLVVPRAAPEIGNTGHVVQLSVERAGSHNAAPAGASKLLDDRPPPPAPPLAGPAAPKPVTATPATPAATTDAASAPPGSHDEPAPVAAASSAAIAGSPQPAPSTPEEHLRRSVLDLLSQRLDYPAIARRKGWQGTVTLRLHIGPDGRITQLQVDRTSGYPVLDRAAVASLQLASVPRAEHWLHGRGRELLVPVEYRLVEG